MIRVSRSRFHFHFPEPVPGCYNQDDRSFASGMAAWKHLWIVASIIVTLAACVVATGGGLAANALTEPQRSAVVRFWPQVYNQTGRQTLQVTVPPVGANGFGQVIVIDADVTIGPDPDSTLIGRGNGAIFFDNMEFPGYDNAVTLTLNSDSGVPQNSSLNFDGFTPYPSVFPEPYDYSVVGGTGAFACAKGVSTQSVFYSNATLTTVAEIAYIVFGCGFNPDKAFYLFF